MYRETRLERDYIRACFGKGRKTERDGESWTAAFCYVLAPVLVSYVLWVLADALERGKRRLYFLSRDGYMMYLAAKFFCEEGHLPLECRYLYCSRYALRQGEYCLLGEKSLDYICLGGMHVTLEKMMRRGGLTEDEALAAGRLMGWEHGMHTPLSYEQVKALKPQLRGNPLFMDRMLARSREEYPLVTGYLRQEGMMEKVPYAIVDSGWTGSMQRSIGRLLRSAGYRGKVEGYYFGLYEYVRGVNPARYHTWYFAPGSGNGRKAFFSNNLFECVFSSPEGMTKGYYRCGKEGKEGKYRPVFAAEENPNRERIEAGASILLRYVACYASYHASYDAACGTSHDTVCGKESAMDMRSRGRMHVMARLLSSFMGNPSQEEAQVFGGYVFDDDVMGEEKSTIVHPFTLKEVREGKFLRRLFRYASGKGHPALQSAWPEACIVLSDDAGGTDLAQTALYKFLLYSRKSLEQGRKNGGI